MLGKISYRQEYYMAPNFKDLSEEVSTPRSKICSMYNGVYFLIDENAELGLSNISVHGFTIEKSTIKVEIYIISFNFVCTGDLHRKNLVVVIFQGRRIMNRALNCKNTWKHVAISQYRAPTQAPLTPLQRTTNHTLQP